MRRVLRLVNVVAQSRIEIAEVPVYDDVPVFQGEVDSLAVTPRAAPDSRHVPVVRGVHFLANVAGPQINSRVEFSRAVFAETRREGLGQIEWPGVDAAGAGQTGQQRDAGQTNH